MAVPRRIDDESDGLERVERNADGQSARKFGRNVQTEIGGEEQPVFEPDKRKKQDGNRDSEKTAPAQGRVQAPHDGSGRIGGQADKEKHKQGFPAGVPQRGKADQDKERLVDETRDGLPRQ